MIDINYNTWEKACNLIKDYSREYGKFYLQLYPFLKYSNLSTISSKQFFDKYVVSGAIFANYDNFDKIDNYCRKKDGSYRNRYLLTPILYIYYISIGLHISNKYKQERNHDICVKYAGDFENNNLHYRTSYQKFVNAVAAESKNYNYYYKLDISDFFNKINIDLLIVRLANTFKFNQKEQFLFKEFMLWCGNGHFPQIECGTTSSFLATIVYFDVIDNRLYNILKKDKDINNFKIFRYVDDLYVLLNIDGRYKDKIENKISTIYENLLYEYNLSINRDKSSFKKCESLFEDLTTFSLLEELPSDETLPPIYKDKLVKFLSNLVTYAENGSITYKKYTELIEKHFQDSEFKYHTNQIMYVLIYKNIDWLKERKVLNRLTKIIENDFNILSIDPRKLVALIVNTHEEELIKNFLNKLYTNAENGNWPISYEHMALQYLLFRNFSSTKLLNKMKNYSPQNVDFINIYYKQDWRKAVLNQSVENQVTKLQYTKTPISFFKFLEIVSSKSGDLLKAQSYNKNYFDSITKNIEMTKFNIHNPKINYRKNELKEIYCQNLGLHKTLWTKINDLCETRNHNPLCHANCSNFTKKQNSRNSILNDIKEINNIIDTIVKDYL